MERRNKPKNLIYFTASYPYGISEQWKRNELEVFKKYFNKITVLPYSYAGNRDARNLVETVEYKKPLFEGGDKIITRDLPGLLPFIFNYKFLEEWTSHKVFLSTPKIKNLLQYLLDAERLKQNSILREIFESSDDADTVFYFYWGIGSANVIPFLESSKAKIVCRFHGGDLYTERHAGNYIPFQKRLLEKIDLVLPCSDFGTEYLIKKFPFVKNKIHTARLGAVSKGKNPSVDNGVLKLVTCSSIIPVKRLNFLCAALSKIDVPVAWTHIGDGVLFDEIKKSTEYFPPNVVAHFTGFVPSEIIQNFYVGQSFDLLVNVSQSEGVPVSIMEAFAAAIPVYATNVGGTGEIVDDAVGKLLPADITPENLAAELKDFYHLPVEDKLQKRHAAFTRYEEKCSAYNNAEELAKLITGI